MTRRPNSKSKSASTSAMKTKPPVKTTSAVKIRPAAKVRPSAIFKYICEGYINELMFDDEGEARFTLLGADDFIVSVKDGDKRKHLLLLQNDSKKINSVLIDASTLFSVENIGTEILLSLKINRLRIRLEFDSPTSVNKFSALKVL